MPALAPDPALDAYEALADAYDRFTAHHDHGRWLTGLLDIAGRHGFRGGRVLDVACGTGKSFTPLLERGLAVTACDLSPAMAEHARRRHPDGAAEVHVCDMRALPGDWGPFEAAFCLDDAINYLLEADELSLAFAAVHRVLAPGGLYVFDVNTLATYRSAFAATFVQQADDAFFSWQGTASAEHPAGARCEAVVEAFVADGDRWRRRTSRHVQRHHPPATVTGALRDSGLELVEVLGQRPGAALHDAPDESSDSKTVYVARRPD